MDKIIPCIIITQNNNNLVADWMYIQLKVIKTYHIGLQTSK